MAEGNRRQRVCTWQMAITTTQQGVITEAEFAKVVILTERAAHPDPSIGRRRSPRLRETYPAALRRKPGDAAQDRKTPSPPRAVAKVGNQFPVEGTANQRLAPALLPGPLRRQGPWLHRSRVPRSFSLLSQARAARSRRDLDQVPVQSQRRARLKRHVGTMGAAAG